MKCPKCQYVRQAADQAPDWQCPACGVAYVKAMKAVAEARAAAAAPATTTPARMPAAANATPAEAPEVEAEEREALLASGQKIVIYSLILNFILQSAQRGQALPAILIFVLSIAVGLYTAWGTLKIGSGLHYSQGRKLTAMAVMFIPLINLMTMIYLSAKVNRILRAAGWQIGLLGAKR